MTPLQLKSALDRLRLTQTGKRGADLFFDVAERKVRRWIAGEYPIDRAVEISLRLMIENGVMPGDIDKRFRENIES